MGKRMTREEFLEAVFSRRYEELKGRELRTVRVRVVGKELSLAQLIGVTDRRSMRTWGCTSAPIWGRITPASPSACCT